MSDPRSGASATHVGGFFCAQCSLYCAGRDCASVCSLSVDYVFNKIDKDDSGKISYSEFLNFRHEFYHGVDDTQVAAALCAPIGVAVFSDFTVSVTPKT